MLTEDEILKLQSNSMESDNESVTNASRKLRKRFKGKMYAGKIVLDIRGSCARLVVVAVLVYLPPQPPQGTRSGS
jgi:hypothetical protein